MPLKASIVRISPQLIEGWLRTISLSGVGVGFCCRNTVTAHHGTERFYFVGVREFEMNDVVAHGAKVRIAHEGRSIGFAAACSGSF